MISEYKGEIYEIVKTGGEFEKKVATEVKIMEWGCSLKNAGIKLVGGGEGLSIKGLSSFIGFKNSKVKKGMILKINGDKYTITKVLRGHPNIMELECQVM